MESVKGGKREGELDLCAWERHNDFDRVGLPALVEWRFPIFLPFLHAAQTVLTNPPPVDSCITLEYFLTRAHYPLEQRQALEELKEHRSSLLFIPALH